MAAQYDYKKIESILFEYPDISRLIQKNELEIEIIKSEYDVDSGRSSNRIKSSTSTNLINSSVEHYILNKERRIEELERRNKTLELKRRMIDIALRGLTDEERDIITERYFKRLNVERVMCSKYYITPVAVYNRCKKIIKEKLSQYIMLEYLG